MVENAPGQKGVRPKDELVGGVRREVIEKNLQKSIEDQHPGELVIFDGREADPTAVLDEADVSYLRKTFRY